jgi:hypothetical protein
VFAAEGSATTPPVDEPAESTPEPEPSEPAADPPVDEPAPETTAPQDGPAVVYEPKTAATEGSFLPSLCNVFIRTAYDSDGVQSCSGMASSKTLCISFGR